MKFSNKTCLTQSYKLNVVFEDRLSTSVVATIDDAGSAVNERNLEPWTFHDSKTHKLKSVDHK